MEGIMKKLVSGALLCAGAVGLIAASCDPVPVGGPSGMTLKFSDDFNGDRLDTSKWSTGWLGSGITPPVQDQELACYDPRQVSVSGGILYLKVVARPTNCNKGTNPHPYASGAINSYGKAEFAYGYFEARIWLDAGSKIYNWPAWWLDGHEPWPKNGELDIMEGLSGRAKGNWHGPVNGGAGFSLGDAGVLSGWHVFAADWSPGKVVTYYDGKKLGEYTSSTNVTSSKQFMNLMEQVGPENRYGGPIKVPSEMRVDYVRVWQR